MSGATPIQTALILDADQFRKELKSAIGQAKAEDKSLADKIRRGVLSAAKQIAGITLGLKSVQAAARQVVASAERLASVRGLADPAVQAFTRVQAATQKAWDGLVLGVLRSKAVQTAMGAVADVLNAAAEKAKNLGGRIDEFVKKHADELAVAGGVLAAMFKVVTTTGDRVKAVWDVTVGSLKAAGGFVIEFLGKVTTAVGALLEKVGFEDVAAKLGEAGAKIQQFGANLVDSGLGQAGEGVDSLVSQVDRIVKAFEDGREKTKKAIEEITPAGELGLFGRLHESLKTGTAKTLVDAMGEIGRSVGDVWQSTTDRIGGLFDKLAEELKEKDYAPALKGVGDLMHGFAALGNQAEAVFGRSSAAAKIGARVQLSLLATECIARAAKAWGDAFSSEGEGNLLGKAANVAAAGAYTGAAALAGARAGGAFGNRGLGLGGGGGSRSSSTRTVESQVARQKTEIIFNISGNLVDNKDYIRRELIPQMRDILRNEDVTFTVTHAQSAGSLQPGRFG